MAEERSRRLDAIDSTTDLIDKITTSGCRVRLAGHGLYHKSPRQTVACGICNPVANQMEFHLSMTFVRDISSQPVVAPHEHEHEKFPILESHGTMEACPCWVHFRCQG